MSKDRDASVRQFRLEYAKSGKQNVDVIAGDQQIRLPEEDERWPLRLLGGEDGAEVGVRRDENPVLLESPCQDFLVACRLNSVRSDVDSIMSRRQKQAGQARRQAHYRSEISNGTRKGQFPLHRRSRGEAQALANIFRLEVRVLRENLRFRQSTRKHAQDGSDWYSQVAHTRDPTHLCGIDRDMREVFHLYPLSLSQLAWRKTIRLRGMLRTR
ncbi:hypothetical protein SBA4_430026 [Candidatus Sulfopaludibacter sp. SbA4]|nr:hypothetical protein SBA4_430026 [Candidatus Sulfopaludibacter sp. SbA4]